jgi:diguanylate cyclase (GGDEF)-like protein/PAS domain S-box-containing protein
MTAVSMASDRRPASRPHLLGDIPVLRRKWHAARVPGRTLPPYEEVVLGSLGRIADHLVLVRGDDAAGSLTVLRAGRGIREWLGAEIAGRQVRDLPPDCSGALAAVVSQALGANEPAYSVAHRVRDGMVETYEMLALPLGSRWGPPLVAIYVREQGQRYSLVDAIFRSTEAGILALAGVRDAAGTLTDFQIIALNDGASRLLQVAADQLRWRRLSDLDLGPQSRDIHQTLMDTLTTGRHHQFELTFGDVHLKVGVAAIGDLLAATLTDIGDLKERETWFRLLFDRNPVPMWLSDPATMRFISVNDAAVAHYGYTRQQFQRMTLLDIRPPEDRERARAAIRTIRDQHSYASERTWRHIKANGEQIEVLSYWQTVSFGARTVLLTALVDVTARKLAEARIAHMAHHDALTNLPNRVLFYQRLEEALGRMRRGESLAVLCLDLDHFKRVNDTLGHPVGDRLLQVVAQRLGAALRETDVVARLDGDEFAVVQIPVRNPNEVTMLAGRLVDALAQPYEIHGHEVVVGASIGIALAPGDGDTPDLLLRNADMALYRAKQEGRGTFHFFEPEMDRHIQARRLLEVDLRKALVNGEFELFYQPLINLGTNMVSGFEALLRWRHRERGMVSPAEFIPIAEETGLIVPLGEWVLRQACAEAATWSCDVKVAVNLSPVQFKSRNLVQTVMSALAYSRLPASRLELEITESVLLDENEANIDTLHRLRALGVRISMDDFGTGYSSLGYLRSFPFDKIKIDQSFVRELAQRPDCMAIIRAIAGLGTSLGIATTAEGVETNEQLERLRAEGCTEAQGYLFSEPRPRGEIEGLLASIRPSVENAA